MPLISVNDIEMYYESHGQGTPPVMIGGPGLDVCEMGALTGQGEHYADDVAAFTSGRS